MVKIYILILTKNKQTKKNCRNSADTPFKKSTMVLHKCTIYSHCIMNINTWNENNTAATCTDSDLKKQTNKTFKFNTSNKKYKSFIELKAVVGNIWKSS